MNEEEIRRLKRHLALQLEKYVVIFKEEFKDVIPSNVLKYLNGITDYEKLIKLEETGTITCFVRGGIMYFPISVDKILKMLSKMPGFGVSPNHKTYTADTLVLNDNTYMDYIKHVFMAGVLTKDFYEEMMLHETMHLCGMAGATAFQEGLTELKTRELAKKYELKTSACGYPKEVKIIYRLQEMFGKTLFDKIAFDMSSIERRHIIYEELGQEEADLFDQVAHLMELEFQTKYYQHHSSFTGLTAPIKKTKKYEEIYYTEVYKVIDEYCNSHKNKIVSYNVKY